jgi:hypothetical protein
MCGLRSVGMDRGPVGITPPPEGESETDAGRRPVTPKGA